MTPKQREAIERHGRELLTIFPDALDQDPVKLYERLRELEGVASRHARRMCSDQRYYDAIIDSYDRSLGTSPLETQLRVLLASNRPWVDIDPFAYALKVDLRTWRCADECLCEEHDYDTDPDGKVEHRERLNTDWGGYGILAPEIGPEGA